MACATLKRSLDWEHISPGNSPPGAGNGNGSGASIHPRPAKRLCSSRSSFLNPLKEASPFGDVEPIMTTDAINAKLTEEFRRLKRQLPSGSRSLTLSSPEKAMIVNNNLLFPPTPCTTPTLGVAGPCPRIGEQPLFTFKQVGLICEKLLREREQQIRDEYDQILGAKLAEQYDTFVKFTYDQIQKRFDHSSTPSYLS